MFQDSALTRFTVAHLANAGKPNFSFNEILNIASFSHFIFSTPLLMDWLYLPKFSPTMKQIRLTMLHLVSHRAARNGKTITRIPYSVNGVAMWFVWDVNMYGTAGSEYGR